MWMCASKGRCPGDPEEDVGIPGARVTCGLKSTGCWELNPGALQEQCLFPTAEPYFP